jgi:putative transposase
MQNVIKKLGRAFERMWTLGAGFPRFKSRQRHHSFSFNNTGFRLAGKYLQIAKIGNVKVRLSREIPDGGLIKSLTVKKSASGWYACFAVDALPQRLAHSDAIIGIDLGIENLAALSDGTFVKNMRVYEQQQRELRRAQRRLRRRKKGSHGRAKAMRLLARFHEHIANRRLDYRHKVTTALVRKYGTIILENLNVQSLARGILSKQVYDAGWSRLVALLKYKAEGAGRRVIEVDAKYTSQECPACGHKKRKLLSERVHDCEKCGYTTHRDTAAAQVILARMEPLGANEGGITPCVA